MNKDTRTLLVGLTQVALQGAILLAVVVLLAVTTYEPAETITGGAEAVSVTRFRSINIQHDLDVDGTANLDDMDIDLSGEFEIDGALTDFGGCTADVADGDNDVCIAAVLEVDGETELDGALDADSTADFADTVTFSKGSGSAAVIAAGGTLTLPATADISAHGYVNVGNGTPNGSVTAGTDEQLYVEGAFEVDGEAEFDGAIDADSTSDFAGTATFSKGSGNAIVVSAGGTLTMPATADLSAYGYVNVGDGTPNGSVTAGTDEQLYVEGAFEVDGEAEFDGAIDADGTSDFADTATFSKGSGNAIVVSAGGTLTMPATADLSVYGYVNVGDGTPNGSVSAGTDEQLYVEGAFEVDGEAEFDGAIDADGTSDFADTATFSKGSGSAVVVSAGGVLTLPATADISAHGYVNVGNGTPDGSVSAGTDEQLYVEGAFEVDGEAEFDGAIDADSTSDFADTATFSKGSGDAVVIAAGAVLSMPATADVSAYGYVAVGDGSPDGSVTAGTDEQLYVEGAVEIDGALDADSTANIAGAVTLQGLLYPSFTDLGVSDGDIITPTYTTYALDTTGNTTVTLAAVGQEGQFLFIINDDANALVIADTNIATSDGNQVSMAGADDVTVWIYQDSVWHLLLSIADS